MMMCESSRLFWLLLTLLFVQPGSSQTDSSPTISCACALEEANHTIVCRADHADLLSAMADLQTHQCDKLCDGTTCENAFYMVQAHHDYCFFNELPATLSTIFHSYETNCRECSILRKSNPALPPCPEPNCENDSGKVAFEFLSTENCREDCSSDDCSSSFQYLRAVYDVCPDGTLDLIAELAVNDWDEPCAPYDCNTNGDASDPQQQQQQLICDPDTLITRPPAIPPPTAAPVPNVCYRLPETTVGDEPSCHICGENQCITQPDNVFSWPQRPDISCHNLQEAGLQGFITFDQCAALPGLAKPTCGCQPADSFIEYNPPSVAPPPPPTPSDASSSNLGMGIGIGMSAAVVLSIGLLVLASKSRQVKQPSDNEIEVPTMTQPRTEQELA